MAHDVFLSYSSKDKQVADAACAALEARKVRCWIAPRDVLPGSEYGAALLDAIEGARIMVLVLSNHSNTSSQVMREVERSVSKGIPILPFRIEDVKLSRSMEYFVSSQHWLDALTPPLEQHLATLCDSVQALLGTRSKTPVPEPDPGAENLNATITAQFQLRVLSGEAAGTVVPLTQARITVGKSNSNDLVLPDRVFSRTHFALNWDAARGVFVFIDFHAANAVKINGETVRGERDLKAGDRLSLGTVEVVFEAVA